LENTPERRLARHSIPTSEMRIRNTLASLDLGSDKGSGVLSSQLEGLPAGKLIEVRVVSTVVGTLRARR